MTLNYFSDMSRAMVALFIVGFFFMFVSFTAGIRGCWKTSPSNITASAILMLIACEYDWIYPSLHGYKLHPKTGLNICIRRLVQRWWNGIVAWRRALGEEQDHHKERH